MSHTSRGDATISVKPPTNHLMPSLESKERTPSIPVAERIQDRSISTSSASSKTNAVLARKRLLKMEASVFIRHEVVDIDDAQFDGTDHKSGGIDASL